MANKRTGGMMPLLILAGLGIAGIAWFFYTVKSAAPPLPATKMPVVFNAQYDGSVWQITDWLEKHIPDYASLKMLHWGKVVHHKDEYMVHVKFRSRNKAGADVVSDKIFVLDGQGDILGVTDFHAGTQGKTTP